MTLEDTIKEPWFIAVVAGVGALILILIIIIIILCCLWFRKKKREDDYDKEDHHQNEDRESSTPSSYQEMTETQNWMMVQQNGVSSAPASSETPRHIKGDEPYIAGSSLIKMNEEMRKNGGPASYTRIDKQKQSYYKSSVEKTLEENKNVDAFDRKISSTSEVGRGGYVPGYPGASVHSSGRLEANEVRESARSNQYYQNPRLANIQVSRSTHSESFVKDHGYLPEKSDSTRATHTTVYQKTSPPYRIPEEDYSGIEMYSDEERYSWRTQGQNHASLHRLSDGNVKNLTEKFETPEVSTANNSALTSRTDVENELRKQLAERRAAAPISPRRTSREFQQDYSNMSVDWQGKSGKHTIDTRVNRFKKVGAVSVFPD